MKNCNRDDFVTFRKRYTNIILATDMANHKTDCEKLSEIISFHSISSGTNASSLIDHSTD